MRKEFYKVLNNQDKTEGAVVFDDAVDFAKRVEIRELVRQSEYRLEPIEEEEFNTIERKFEV